MRPGTGSHSPARQSAHRAARLGDLAGRVVQRPGSRRRRGARRGARRPARRTLRAIVWNVSQSVRASHGGGTAWLNECTNGCMSVIDRSYFSYHVAAGSTTSEYSPVVVMRKSTLTSRSSLPRGISLAPAHARRALARRAAARPAARRAAAPSRWRRKYSWPLPEEPSRFERHTKNTRGKLAGALGSSTAKRSRPGLELGRRRARPASRRRPAASSASSSGLRSNVGNDGIQPIRTALACASIAVCPSNRPRAQRRWRSAPGAAGHSATARCAW